MAGILERISNGDETASDACVREYGGLIWRLACRYLDRAESEIEDAVQDVFIEIWLHANRYDPAKGSEASFVATLAHRRLIDRQRRVVAHRRKLSEYTKELQARGTGNSGNSTATGDFAYNAQLKAGFEALPDDERNALWLSAYKGLSHRDISEATEVPIGTVKSRLRRAMIRLTEGIRGGTDSHGTRQAIPEGGQA